MVYLFLADGFEEMEAIAPIDVLRRGGVEIVTVSITDSLAVTGSHGITINADIIAKNLDLDAADGVILPGGIPGTPNLKASEYVKNTLEKVNAKGGLVAAICAAPSVLGAFGYLKGKRATCFPGFEGELEGAQYVKEFAVTDGNVVTGCGAGGAYQFAFELLKYFKGKDAADALKKGMLYE